jgi:hypothetical protein
MSYDSVILLTDVGIIGTITAVIVILAVLLGRKEARRVERTVAPSSVGAVYDRAFLRPGGKTARS